MVVVLVDVTIFGCLAFTHGFLCLVNGDTAWPPAGTVLPELAAPAIAAALVAGSGALLWLADLMLRRGRTGLVLLAVLAAFLLPLLGLDGDLTSLWAAGVRPTADSFGAAAYASQFWQRMHGAVVLVMALCLAARCWAELAWWIRCAASPSTMFACSACSGSTR